MDDMERYGDYNEVDESPTTSPLLRVIKLVAIVITFAIIGLIGFRIFTFNYYPAETKAMYFTDGLREYYDSTSGDMTILTQKLRSSYDDPTDGNIFCDHLRVVREAGYLQITLRFNNSFEDTLLNKYLTEVNLSDESLFSFRLVHNGDENATAGTLVSVEWSEFMMYRYARLVFEDVDFGEGDDKIKWLRLETYIDGVKVTEKNKTTGKLEKTERDKIFMNLIYEDHDTYSKFTEHKLTREEEPK